MTTSGSSDLDLSTISWEDHPVLRAIETNRILSLHRMVTSKWFKKLGTTSLNHARTLKGEPCLILALSKFASFQKPKQFRDFIALLLNHFNVDSSTPDRQGRSALSYAILHDLGFEMIELLLEQQVKHPEVAHHFSAPLLYAAAMNRRDVVELILSQTQSQVGAPLCKFISLNDNVFTPRIDLLDIPYTLEGSPKRYTPFTDSPLNGAPVNGIRFRLSPSSPCCSSGAVSPLANNRNPSVSLASSENSKSSVSKSVLQPDTRQCKIRRISSGFFDTNLCGNGVTFNMLSLVQLGFNLSVYFEACLNNSYTDRSPDPFTDERSEIRAEGSMIISSAVHDGTKGGVLHGDEKAEIMVGIEASSRRKSSAPILIKSRSVEAAMNSRKPQRDSVDQLSFCVMPRDVRKNALQSSHLIERQGSAPQLMLKRKPKGPTSNEGSLGTSPVGSPVTGLSRCGTRQHITTKGSPLGTPALTQYMRH